MKRKTKDVSRFKETSGEDKVINNYFRMKK